MAGYRSSRVIPVALVLIITAVAIAALVSLARTIFFPSNQTQQVDVSHETLISLAVDNSVTFTVRGSIVADENFHSYRIKITPTTRTLTTYVGYLDQKVDEVSLTNNTPSYEEFVYALDRAGFVKGAELTGDSNDLRGICATGRVYEFELLKADKSIKKLWATTCNGNLKGSLEANSTTLKNLFIKQIPEAASITSKIIL
jgi:hypothetical protein